MLSVGKHFSIDPDRPFTKIWGFQHLQTELPLSCPLWMTLKAVALLERKMLSFGSGICISESSVSCHSYWKVTGWERDTPSLPWHLWRSAQSSVKKQFWNCTVSKKPDETGRQWFSNTNVSSLIRKQVTGCFPWTIYLWLHKLYWHSTVTARKLSTYIWLFRLKMFLIAYLILFSIISIQLCL